MHTSLSKKLLAGLLSLVMVLSLVAPSTSAQAATKYSLTDKKSVKSGVTFKYQLKGVSKGCYVKVTRNVSGEKVVYNKKELTKTTKVNGTGKTLNLYVTYGEKDENYTGKFTVRVYGKKTNKLYKTLVEEVTVKVPEKEEPEEPVEEEAALVSLEATGVKELTATLSKTAEITAKDLIVKRGDVVVTPADVTVNDTKVVISLASRIVEGTYSVTYKEVTKEVKTEDEKVTELKTVGNNLAELKDEDCAVATGSAIHDALTTTVNATIEYQALNQYGEATSAEINNVVSSFGGNVKVVSEPTAKKNGRIEIYDIAASLGIVGNTGKVIIVSKSGVSTTNEVVFAEESKLAKMELVGIYNTNKSTYVDTINAGADLTNYSLIFSAYDQYGYSVDEKKVNGQTYSVAQVLTNACLTECDYIATSNGAISKDLANAADIEINDAEYVQIPLSSSKGTAGNIDTAAVAGTLQLIVVGDRFGTVFNGTITIEEYDLIKTFSVSAPDRIYDKQENTLEYTAISVSGKEITDYKTLNKFVDVDETAGFEWVKNSDGSASLVYEPQDVCTTSSTSDAHTANTVTSTVFNVNKADGVSAANVIVVTKTFTVYEAPIAKSVIKYTGSTANASNSVTIYGTRFALEDQYGNTMTGDEDSWASTVIWYQLDDGTAVSMANIYATASITTGGISATKKMYVSVDGTAFDDEWTFDKNKADYTISFVETDSKTVTNLTATWAGTTGSAIRSNTYYYINSTLAVSAGALKSGITVDDIAVYGMSKGKQIRIPNAQLSIKSDTYEPISAAEALTAVKTATVTITVQLVDGNNEEYTEEITCDYQYSAAPSKFEQILTSGELSGYGYSTVASNGAISAGGLSTSNLTGYFHVYDQYGNDVTSQYTQSLEISLGRNTSNLKVVNNNSANAEIKYNSATLGTDVDAEIVVTCTLNNGKTATEYLYVNLDGVTAAP